MTFLAIDEWISKFRFCCCNFLSYEGFCYGNLLTYGSCCSIKIWVNRMLNLCHTIHSMVVYCMNDRLSHNKAMCVCTQTSTLCMAFWYFLVELYNNSTCEICATESIVQTPVITLPYIMQCICLHWRKTLSINDKTSTSPSEVLIPFLVCFPLQVLVIISPSFTTCNTINSNR